MVAQWGQHGLSSEAGEMAVEEVRVKMKGVFSKVRSC